MSRPSHAVILDLDGTLVDSVFWHVVCWQRTLQEHGHRVPAWRIHAGIGMGSDRLLAWLLGGHSDDADEMADGHSRRFLEVGEHLAPTPGAGGLLADLERRGIPYVVATSAGREERELLLEVLERPGLATTDADDVSSSKPDPALLQVALDQLKVDAPGATLVGDSPWDAEAAQRLGIRTVAVRCGGFGDGALRRAGAAQVVDHPAALIGRL